MITTRITDNWGNPVSYLTQWDIGVELNIEIYGVKITDPLEIHFANEDSDHSYVVKSSKVNEATVRTIVPNALLTNPKRIYAYIYIGDSSNGRTVQVLDIPVRSKPLPDGYEYVNNPEVIELNTVVKRVELLAQQVAEDRERAESAADRAESGGGSGGGSGEPGKDGKDGESAYQIAVRNGFVGTEEQWLESLKGKDGKDGVNGVDGQNGLDGKPGEDGQPGKDGQPGQDGFSPTITTSKVGKTTTITITDKTGTKTAEIKDGEDGVGGGGVAELQQIDMAETTAVLEPNKYYKWGEVTNLTITLGKTKPNVVNEYQFEFKSGKAPTTLSLPQDIKWSSPLNVEANKTYQASIVNGIGVFVDA